MAAKLRCADSHIRVFSDEMKNTFEKSELPEKKKTPIVVKIDR